jgi:hypothetical protein
VADARPFDPAAILRILEAHDVRYVLIGGLAASLHGSPHVTTDVDISPSADRDNLVRLAAALGELDARYGDIGSTTSAAQPSRSRCTTPASSPPWPISSARRRRLERLKPQDP